MRSRSLSITDQPSTRLSRALHKRQLSGPIDVDISAATSLSKLSISPTNGTNSLASAHSTLISTPFSPHFSSRKPLISDTKPVSIEAESARDFLVDTDADMYIVAADTCQRASPLDVFDANKYPDSDISETTSRVTGIPPYGQHDNISPQTRLSPSSSSPLGSPSTNAANDKTLSDAPSPLPLSSMPVSPATSLDAPSPSKPRTSRSISPELSSAISSPRSMSVDLSRASSSSKPAIMCMSSPVKASRSLAFSSPTPSTSVLGKRAASDDECESSTPSKTFSSKRIRTDGTRSSPPSVPAATTRRQTATSQLRSQKKLTAPFRTPFMSKAPLPSPDLSQQVKSTQSTLPLAAATSTRKEATPDVAKTMAQLATKSRAAAQFRSPMALRGTTGGSRPVLLPTATIQTLERKVMALKRAIKIKRGGDEQKLVALATKWREAGREAAYEFWDLTRDMVAGETEMVASGGAGWRSGWGWGEDDAQGGASEGQDEQDDAMKVDEEVEKPQETLGIMLRKLGIDPQSLGWDDALESFVD